MTAVGRNEDAIYSQLAIRNKWDIQGAVAEKDPMPAEQLHKSGRIIKGEFRHRMFIQQGDSHGSLFPGE